MSVEQLRVYRNYVRLREVLFTLTDTECWFLVRTLFHLVVLLLMFHGPVKPLKIEINHLKACSASCVVWEPALFGLHAGNRKFSALNKECINTLYFCV